jgi:hypothetical protein
MAIISRPKIDSSHWYKADGTPLHHIKDAKGDDRPTTLRDAKKLMLIPSVTNILGVLSKEALTTWKINQAIIACLANPKQADEPDDAYCRRIQSTSMEQVFDAADLGSAIHKSIENYLNEGEEPAKEYRAYVDPVIKWLLEKEIKITASEKILVNTKHGYAGTCDLLFTFDSGRGKGVLDFKTRKTTPGEKVRTWDTEPMQLAAYAATAYGQDHLDDCLVANIIISTTEPGRFEIVKHKDVYNNYIGFLSCCNLWRLLKGHDPRVNA